MVFRQLGSKTEKKNGKTNKPEKSESLPVTTPGKLNFKIKSFITSVNKQTKNKSDFRSPYFIWLVVINCP